MDQTLSIPIEVKNIHYILATLHTPTSKLKFPETKIPAGMNIALKITLHDNLGNEFSHNLDEQVSGNLQHKLSRKEMADINVGANFTVGVSFKQCLFEIYFIIFLFFFQINLPRENTGMLAISLKDTLGVKYSEDYIKLSVAQSDHIFPTKVQKRKYFI